jgi:hypothetical protein
MVPLYEIKEARFLFYLIMKDFAEDMIQEKRALTVELCLKEHGHPVLCNACLF